MGSLKTDVQIPDLRKRRWRIEFLVLSSQRVSGCREKGSGRIHWCKNQTELVAQHHPRFHRGPALVLAVRSV